MPKRSGKARLVNATVDDFIYFNQPKINQLLRALTEHRRRNKDGSPIQCPACQQWVEKLDAAHDERSLNQIIWDVLWPQRTPGLETGEWNLDEVFGQILGEHTPLDEVYQFICTPCHKALDRQRKAEGKRPEFPTEEMEEASRQEAIDLIRESVIKHVGQEGWDRRKEYFGWEF